MKVTVNHKALFHLSLLESSVPLSPEVDNWLKVVLITNNHISPWLQIKCNTTIPSNTNIITSNVASNAITTTVILINTTHTFTSWWPPLLLPPLSQHLFNHLLHRLLQSVYHHHHFPSPPLPSPSLSPNYECPTSFSPLPQFSRLPPSPSVLSPPECFLKLYVDYILLHMCCNSDFQ